MPAIDTEQSGLTRRPKRADARRNYDKLIAAARDAFTERDASASLEEIARRADVAAPASCSCVGRRRPARYGRTCRSTTW
jgi:hypothetical protein